MQVDPKEAARRLRAWNEYGEGADSGTPNEPGYTHDSLDFQRDLRALLSERDAATARAEGAERERADLRAGVDEWYEKAVRYISERDAARAERDRMKAALEEIAAGKFKCTWRQAHIAMQEVARAALGAAKEADHG